MTRVGSGVATVMVMDECADWRTSSEKWVGGWWKGKLALICYGIVWWVAGVADCCHAVAREADGSCLSCAVLKLYGKAVQGTERGKQ